MRSGTCRRVQPLKWQFRRVSTRHFCHPINSYAPVNVIIVGTLLTLFSGASETAAASTYKHFASATTSREYVLPSPFNSARLEVSNETLVVHINGRNVPIDNAWLQSVPNIDLESAALVGTGEDDLRLFVLIACYPSDDDKEHVVLEIRNLMVIDRQADECHGA